VNLIERIHGEPMSYRERSFDVVMFVVVDRSPHFVVRLDFDLTRPDGYSLWLKGMSS
jgi:hypothetical protein